MYCKHCGAPIPEKSQFCPKCGQIVTKLAPADEMEHGRAGATEAYRAANEAVAGLTGGRMTAKTIAIAAAAVVVLGGIVLGMHRGGESTDA